MCELRACPSDPVALNPAGPGVEVGAGVVVAVGVAAGLGRDVPAVGAGVGAGVTSCEGVAPTPAEQPATMNTASTPATARRIGRWRGARREWMRVSVVARGMQIATE